jgi:hypothetical protein
MELRAEPRCSPRPAFIDQPNEVIVAQPYPHSPVDQAKISSDIDDWEIPDEDRVADHTLHYIVKEFSYQADKQVSFGKAHFNE